MITIAPFWPSPSHAAFRHGPPHEEPSFDLSKHRRASGAISTRSTRQRSTRSSSGYARAIRDHACSAVADPVNFTAVAPVAQLDRALRFERSGRRFESVRARQFSKVLTRAENSQVLNILASLNIFSYEASPWSRRASNAASSSRRWRAPDGRELPQQLRPRAYGEWMLWALLPAHPLRRRDLSLAPLRPAVDQGPYKRDVGLILIR
jgi:hypothetical protein